MNPSWHHSISPQWRKLILIGAPCAAAALAASLLLSRPPGEPSVQRPSLSMDTVKQGELLREVRDAGTLVPVEVRWIATVNPGRVDRILVSPGAAVKADTVLVELANPSVEQAALDAQWSLRATEASRTNLCVQLGTQKLTQQAAVASAQANYNTAKLDLGVNEELATNGLIPMLTLNESRAKTEELQKLYEIEKLRLQMTEDAANAQLAVQDANIAELREQLDSKRRLVDALKIRAGMDGVLQRYGDPSQPTPLQEGQQLLANAIVARVASQSMLKAALKIPETDAKDIALGQPAQIDTHNGVIQGHVTRIDPASEHGTVAVEVALNAGLPPGARPDLNVDGTIQVERLVNVLYVNRPATPAVRGALSLFKVIAEGREAVRVPVKLGCVSMSAVEVMQGLSAGDQIILSDMSRWNTCERLRLDE